MCVYCLYYFLYYFFILIFSDFNIWYVCVFLKISILPHFHHYFSFHCFFLDTFCVPYLIFLLIYWNTKTLLVRYFLTQFTWLNHFKNKVVMHLVCWQLLAKHFPIRLTLSVSYENHLFNIVSIDIWHNSAYLKNSSLYN